MSSSTKRRNGGGRKGSTSLTPEMVESIGRYIGTGITEAQAAAAAGIPYSTLRYWLTLARQGRGGLHAELLAVTTRARTASEVRATATIVRATAEDWRAAAWWLTHHPSTRGHWSEAGAIRHACAQQLEQVIDAVEATIRDGQLRHQLLEALKFRGVLQCVEEERRPSDAGQGS